MAKRIVKPAKPPCPHSLSEMRFLSQGAKDNMMWDIYFCPVCDCTKYKVVKSTDPYPNPSLEHPTTGLS